MRYLFSLLLLACFGVFSEAAYVHSLRGEVDLKKTVSSE